MTLFNILIKEILVELYPPKTIIIIFCYTITQRDFLEKKNGVLLVTFPLDVPVNSGFTQKIEKTRKNTVQKYIKSSTLRCLLILIINTYGMI